MKLYLNNDSNNIIRVTSFFRGLDRNNDSESYFRYEFNFTGDYISSDLDKLAMYANQEITDITIVNKNDETVLDLHNISATLQNLYENYNDDSKNGNATIRVSYKAKTEDTE